MGTTPGSFEVECLDIGEEIPQSPGVLGSISLGG